MFLCLNLLILRYILPPYNTCNSSTVYKVINSSRALLRCYLRECEGTRRTVRNANILYVFWSVPHSPPFFLRRLLKWAATMELVVRRVKMKCASRSRAGMFDCGSLHVPISFLRGFFVHVVNKLLSALCCRPPKGLKPCCACPETRKPRDAWCVQYRVSNRDLN